MSLNRAHPLWTTCENNPFHINQAIIQCCMLSGKYRIERLCRFFSSNKEGICLLHPLDKVHETISHIIEFCPGLNNTRQQVLKYWDEQSKEQPIIRQILNSIDNFTAFVLDCSTQPVVIRATQDFGQVILKILFKLTRTMAYSLHRDRLKQLDRWNKI